MKIIIRRRVEKMAEECERHQLIDRARCGLDTVRQKDSGQRLEDTLISPSMLKWHW